MWDFMRSCSPDRRSFVVPDVVYKRGPHTALGPVAVWSRMVSQVRPAGPKNLKSSGRLDGRSVSESCVIGHWAWSITSREGGVASPLLASSCKESWRKLLVGKISQDASGGALAKGTCFFAQEETESSGCEGCLFRLGEGETVWERMLICAGPSGGGGDSGRLGDSGRSQRLGGCGVFGHQSTDSVMWLVWHSQRRRSSLRVGHNVVVG